MSAEDIAKQYPALKARRNGILQERHVVVAKPLVVKQSIVDNAKIYKDTEIDLTSNMSVIHKIVKFRKSDRLYTSI